MRKYLLAFGLIVCATANAALDDYYYTAAEIAHELDSLAAAHPTIMRVDSIGYAWASQQPILSVKLSANVDQELDKPAFWVNGQCHAEEILGVNISMAFIRELAHFGDLGHPNFTPLLQAMEIHVVPTNNPDGMDVVVLEDDVTYRKNLHNFLPDDDCQITPGIGNDSCGVDLNRNYPAWFSHGDPLWAVNSDAEQFDYFRGPDALSEPEVYAVYEQTERERFVAAVAYHSARTSTNHEIIIHPWEWEEGKRCPQADYDLMQDVSRTMGDQIAGQDFEFYRNLAGSGRKGNHHNWIYNAYGALGLLIEVGLQQDAGMQPQSQASIDFIVDENLDGLYWLCRRIIGYQQDAPGLKLHTMSEADTPLETRLRIEEVMHPDCTPWYRTDAQWGAYYRLLDPGVYTLGVRKHGFLAVNQEMVIGNSAPTAVDVTLEALPVHQLDLTFQSNQGSALVVDRIELLDHNADTTLVWENSSHLQVELPAGMYTMHAISETHISAVTSLDLGGPLSGIQTLYGRNAEEPNIDVLLDQLSDFSQTGAECGWILEDDEGQLTFKDHSGQWSPDNMDCALVTQQSYMLDAIVRERTPGTLEFDYRYLLEGERDSAFVVVQSLSEQESTTVMRMTGRSLGWQHAVVDLTDWIGQEVRFEFRVKTDQSIHDEGLALRNVHLSWSVEATAVEPNVSPQGFSLGIHPNPFNPRTTVRLDIPASELGASLTLNLYDLLGRKVRTLAENQPLTTGSLLLAVDGSDLASGVYLLHATIGRDGRTLYSESRRMALIK